MNPRLRRAVRFAVLLFPAVAAVVFLIRSAFAAQDFGPTQVSPTSYDAQEQGPAAHPFSITARRYKFEPARIEVVQNDVVKIELRAEDIAHSWTVDDYRIAKRVSPGQPVSFEFRADKAGTFPFYCNLQIEDGCRQMRGELIVKPHK
jgi:heme/copper-type cytochrome/quinol oxidase subunit 2